MDDALEGPDSAHQADPFGLVRLRLSLALLAAALVPIIVVSVILPTLFGGLSEDDRQRIEGRSLGVSASLAGELQRIRSSLLLISADRSISDGVAKGTISAGAGRLATLLPLLDDEVSSARLIGRGGLTWPIGNNGRLGASRPSTAGETRLLAATSGLGRDGVYASGATASGATTSVGAAASGAGDAGGASGPTGRVPGLTSGQTSGASTTAAGSGLILAAPIASSDPAATSPVGAVQFNISMSAVLSRVAGSGDGGAGYVLVLDTKTGDVIADSRGGQAETVASGIPGFDSLVNGIVQRANRAWTSLVNGGWAVGMSPLAGLAEGSPGWSVLVAQPAGGASTPIGLLAALSALTLILIGLAFWMSAQVLRPARELEASRVELRRLYEVARNEALLDPLTGIGNQRAFTEEFDRQLEGSRRHNLPLALLLLDLDDFKAVNDRGGHPAGDRLLVSFAGLIRSTVRANDRAFRLGGDEFGIIMPATDSEGAEVVARRLLGRALNPISDSEDARSSFSAGIAAAPAHGALRAELYAGADAALYWCKRHGRTGVEVFDPLRHHVNPSLGGELSSIVLDVVKRRDLKVLFQPIVSLADGDILGYEALTRPTAGSSFADAGSFFSAAQSSGRQLEVDVACLDLVTAASAALVPLDRLISLNLSPVTLEAAEFSANRLRRLLERHGLAPDRIVVELTEREPIDDLDRVQRNVEALRELGVRVAADDVGAGNSGLQLLSQVRFDIVKIDISLVQDAAIRRRSLEVMKSLVAIAHNWGATVIAEGIETPQQLQAVRALGVDAGQGYLLGRPAERCDPSRVDLEARIRTSDRSPRPSPFAVPVSPTA